MKRLWSVNHRWPNKKFEQEALKYALQPKEDATYKFLEDGSLIFQAPITKGGNFANSFGFFPKEGFPNEEIQAVSGLSPEEFAIILKDFGFKEE